MKGKMFDKLSERLEIKKLKEKPLTKSELEAAEKKIMNKKNKK